MYRHTPNVLPNHHTSYLEIHRDSILPIHFITLLGETMSTVEEIGTLMQKRKKEALIKIVKVVVPEGKLWSLLDQTMHLRRTHQAMPRKDERVVYFTCINDEAVASLTKTVQSL